MTASEERKQGILIAISDRGWSSKNLYPDEARELREAGLIKTGLREFFGGDRKLVWVAS